MKYTELNNGRIEKMLARYRELLENVKVYQPTSLFEVKPDWKQLFKGRCPVCGSLLKKPYGKSISICYGKRHGDKKKFIIKNKVLADILND